MPQDNDYYNNPRVASNPITIGGNDPIPITPSDNNTPTTPSSFDPPQESISSASTVSQGVSDINSPPPPSSVMTSPPQAPSKYGGKKVISTVFAVALLLIGISSTVILVQRKQLVTGHAGDCSKYVFEVTKGGMVVARNGATYTQPSQNANVFINDVLEATFEVPALQAGHAASLGVIKFPESQSFTWRVDGGSACNGSGKYEANAVPTP